jgi:hypothetical protein
MNGLKPQGNIESRSGAGFPAAPAGLMPELPICERHA